MTLQEIASFVCNKIGKLDATSLTICKEFIKSRYRLIWEGFTWNDSKIIVTQSLPSGTSELTINSQVEFVIDISWKGLLLENISAEAVMRWNPALLDPNQSGGPLQFITLPKSGGACVVRFITKPTVTDDILIVGKRVYTPLVNDDDEPLLRGIDNALIAYAYSDMLERERRPGTAQIALQEAVGMIAQMVEIETQQQTKIQRLVPRIFDHVGGRSGYTTTSKRYW